MDPIRLNLVARNIGTGAITNADNFQLTVALSEDITFDQNDFILREINLGSGLNSIGS